MSDGLLPGRTDHRYLANGGFQSDALHSGNDRHTEGSLQGHPYASREQRLRGSSLNDGHREWQSRQSPRRSIQTGHALLNAHLIDPLGYTSRLQWDADLSLPTEGSNQAPP